MRMRTLGSLCVGFLLCNVTLSAQAPAPLPGASMPGPPVPRPQAPAAGPVRDNAPTPTGTAKILGRVVSADTGNPLRRAQVQIFATEQRLMKSAITDAEGRYAFDGLPAGRYQINVSRNGYVNLSFGQQRAFEPGKPLSLVDGQIAEKIDFALPRGGVIAGRITDELGEPLAGVGVRVMRYQYLPDGRRRLMPAGGMGNPYNRGTDDLGQFRLYGLTPGSYVVSATMSSMGGNMMTGPDMTVGSGSNDGSDGFAPTYYPGTVSEEEAQAVTVNVGQESSVFFSMVPARLSRVSGVVRTSQGRPPSNVMLSMRTKDNMGFGFGSSIGADGAFIVRNIPPGDYFLEVRPAMRGPAPAGTTATEPEFASVPITVAGQDIAGLILTTGMGGRVSGRVVVENGTLQSAAVGSQPFQIYFSGSEPFSSMPMGAMEPGAVNASGEFELKGVIGKGTFRPTGTSLALKSVTLDGRDITDTPFEMKAGTNVTGLEITLTKTQTTLSGQVQSGLGAAKDYVLVIFPGNVREGDLPTRFIRTVRPDQDGKYQTKGLPAGDYFAIAMEAIEQGEQWDPAFHDRMKPRATNFRLSEGQTLTLDLRLQTAP
jgi:hypothetical protein